MSELDAFRAETREWLETNCPAGVRRTNGAPAEVVWGGRRAQFYHEDAKLWLDRMAERGWTVPRWPVEYGGAGLSGEQDAVLKQELKRIEANPPVFSFGIAMLAPALMEFASEEQKREHLPRIARGEIRWCQGYSEPGAGPTSRACARARCAMATTTWSTARRSGPPTPTSPTGSFCLVRTDPDVPKHSGISFLLIDMESPGVSVSPIELISGASPFCETFFDEVRVPVANRVGEENNGWTIAKRLLQHERAMLSENVGGGRGPKRKSVLELARETLDAPDGPLPDPAIREELVQQDMDRMCYNATFRRSTDAAKAGRGPGPETSMFKLYLSELNQRTSDLRQRVVGADGLGWEGDSFADDEIQITREWLYGKAGTILGGTSEIQLNVIAKRVLGLPD